MINDLRVYLRYIGISMRGQMQYRASFIMEAIGQFVVAGAGFLGIVVLFDRLLLRPRPTALQLAGQELVLRRVGRLVQGIVILVWASVALDVDWTVVKAGLTVATFLCGACLFFGLVVLQATLAFWTTETLEIINTVTYGGVETAQYPLTIYRPWFRHFFTFVVPWATVSYFPALAILDKPDPLGSPLWFQYAAPVIGLVFLILCLRVWEFGVRHYLSTGS